MNLKYDFVNCDSYKYWLNLEARNTITLKFKRKKKKTN